MTMEHEEEKPLDPAVERVRKRMIRALIVSIGTLFIGLLALLFAIVYKFGNRAEEPARAVAEQPVVTQAADGTVASVDLPEGARINETHASGRLLVLDVSLADGKRRFYAVDLDSLSVRIVAID